MRDVRQKTLLNWGKTEAVMPAPWLGSYDSSMSAEN
ncbi:MAG: hypothetical protein PWQ41_38 [Bacillota bacterium]|nr:hypothetical protein [Bacillota bacterium]